MNFKYTNKLVFAFTASVIMGCGGSAPILSTPVENIDNTPIKETPLTEIEEKNWGHLDLVKDTIPGMSVDKAYAEIIKDKKGKEIIVAVIDSGIDIAHEDLDDVIWTNKKEIPNNGKDDDKNGYIDDIHGWNFLGDAYPEQLEYTRIVASGNTKHPLYASAKAKQDEEYQKWTGRKNQYEQIYSGLLNADEAVSKHLGKKEYTLKEVNAIETTDQALLGHIGVIKQIYGFGLEDVSAAKKELKGALEQITGRLNHNLNVDFKGRTTKDNVDDFTEIGYGNNNVMPTKKDESHGTHVAAIIAAERNNGKGANGVANNVKIMSLRVVPDGDEYDKDVALAIRYAVDNGAKIINGSFGKQFSPHADKVRDAIAYAGKKGVIFVHAAGNDSVDIDVTENYPDDNDKKNPEVSNTFISVGALAPSYGTNLVANFSNYGKKNVDVFAPGAEIYSATPENEYKTFGGTSMASPAVAGVAALVWSQYPKLKAAQVKDAVINSGLKVNKKVAIGGDVGKLEDFSNISKTGRMVNAYNALIYASKLK